jgi:DNA polymerase-3 subunit epsilon
VEELSELGVLVVDCQATGANPAHGAVLELGWGIAKANLPGVEQLQAHWVTLPPRTVVPFQVRRLTGFDESLVAAALSPREAWERLRVTTSFADRIPAAIHFAKFELAFLRDWATRFEPGSDFPLDAVCVHAIACRLYPDLPRRSLRALAGFLGYGLDPARRRSMGHVEATAFIWRKLAAELSEKGIHTWNQLGDWLYGPTVPHSRKRRFPLTSARYRALPDAPGVYRFMRSNGDVLYVGKAASLRKRVAGHFTAGSSTTERALEMLTQVHDVHIAPARTALEAALLEIEEIRTHRPPYNVQLIVDDPRTWFCNQDLDSASSSPDAIHRYGPLPSTFSTRSLSAIRRLVSGETPTASLCASAVGAPERWPPDEAVFAEGFGSFAARHSLTGFHGMSAAQRALASAAKKLIVAAKLVPSAEAGAGAAHPEAVDRDRDEALATGAWDKERVVRHLERAVLHAHQLLYRARWLCLLRESVVVFSEPPCECPRMLRISRGSVVEAIDVSPDVSADVRPPELIDRSLLSQPLSHRKLGFDRGEYDRLRTLTTELKRVLRDGGSAAVRVGHQRWLRVSTLTALLRWV